HRRSSVGSPHDRGVRGPDGAATAAVRRSVRQQRAAGRDAVPAGGARRQGQRRAHHGAGRRRQSGAVQSRSVEVRRRIRPGGRVAYTDEREIQHALDAGALVVVVPTVDSKAEAIEARNWTYFPPLGRRSNGGGQAFDGAMFGGVPGGYRNTINDNVVLIEMIETLQGLQD